MLRQLAWRNVRRSITTYRLYFLTLSVAVSLFYLFNSLGDQQQIIEFSQMQLEILGYTQQALGVVSIIVTIILGFLVVYANHFLLQQRKKEFGLYLTLGMGQRQVLKILWLETCYVAGLALLLGIIIGILGTQVMSLITSQLFGAEITTYEFVFSVTTIVKTVIYFVLMFITVACLNAWRFSRYQLRELLVAKQRSQIQEPKQIKVKVLGFIASIGSVAIGYSLIMSADLIMNLIVSGIGACLVLGGTVGILYTGTTVTLEYFRKRKSSYFHSVNIVVIRQLFYQFHLNIATISIVSLLLFATMTTLALGFSYKDAVEANLQRIAPFDATIVFQNSAEYPDMSAAEALLQADVNLDDFGQSDEINLYRTPVTENDFFAQYQNANSTLQTFFDHGATVNISAVSVSDYNQLMDFQGKAPIQLLDNHIALISNVSDMEGVLAQLVKAQTIVSIEGKGYTVQTYAMESIQNENYGRDTVIFVLPDEAISGFEKQQVIANLYLNPTNSEQTVIQLQQLQAEFFDNPRFNSDIGYFTGITKAEIYQETTGQTTLWLYVGIYIGIVSLVASVTVLAIQQLIEVNQSRERYQALKRIGVTQADIKKIIRYQIGFYFGIPLLIATIHTAITIPLVITNVPDMNFEQLLNPLVFTFVLFMMIYGGYSYMTYTSYCQVLKEKNVKGR